MVRWKPEMARPPFGMPLELGYNWSEEPNSTHFFVVPEGSITHVDTTNVGTLWIDLEIGGLVPNTNYRLEPTTADMSFIVTAPSSPQGRAVFWTLPNTPSTWSLKENSSLVTSIVFDPPTAVNIQSSVKVGHGCYWNYRWHCPSATEARVTPSSTATGGGAVLELMAASYSPDFTVTVAGCGVTTNSIGVWASGGQAVQAKTGRTYTYQREICYSVTSSGIPQWVYVAHPFVREEYSDNSVRIYMAGHSEGAGGVIRAYDDWATPREYATSTWYLDPGANFQMTATRQAATNEYFEGSLGSEAFGVGIGAQLSGSRDGSVNTVIKLTNPHHFQTSAAVANFDAYQSWLPRVFRSG